MLFVLVGNALFLPLLYFTLRTNTRVSAEENYLNHVRGYSRFVADLIENHKPPMSDADVIGLMDTVMLGPDGAYAEVRFPDRRLRSSILGVPDEYEFMEDFVFNSHDDGVYYLSLPVTIGADQGQLLLGYSEADAALNMEKLQQQILLSLGTYLLVAVLMGIGMGVALGRPLIGLKNASRRVALGEHSKVLSAGTSIAEVVELAQDLEFMRSELVQVNERLKTEIEGREVLEARLRHSQRVETIGTMAGGIAHEFNNILVPIMLYTSVAIEDLPQDGALRGYMLRVQGAAQRARDLVQKILTFSRQLEAVEKGPVDFGKIVREATDLFFSLSPSTLDIKVVIADEPCFVFGDGTMLHQVVLNLCSNALKAIRGMDGKIRVTLKKTTRLSNSALPDEQGLAVSYAILTVEDDGIGMDQATSERIFEPFFTTRTVGEGTGLGLSVVHGIVMAHGGDIMVDSDMGIGSIFTIHLPMISEGSIPLQPAKEAV